MKLSILIFEWWNYWTFWCKLSSLELNFYLNFAIFLKLSFESLATPNLDPLLDIGVAAEPVNGTVLNKWRALSRHDVWLQSFRDSKSPQVFGMSTLIIRKVLKEIAAGLTKLLNECLDASFPQTFLKIARVVTIFNKGDPNNTESKRSIAMCRLLLVLSKMYWGHNEKEI